MPTPDLAHLLEHLEALRYGHYRVVCTSPTNTPFNQRKFAVKDLMDEVWDFMVGEFVYEPLPSNRSAAHLKNTRFCLQEAVEIAQKHHREDPDSLASTGGVL